MFGRFSVLLTSSTAVDDNGTITQTTQAASTSSTPVQPLVDPNIGQYVYDRYFQKVTLSDFMHSKQLLQYANERRITPSTLWNEFKIYIESYNIENTLANLIEYLSLSPEKLEKNYTYIDVNKEDPKQRGWLDYNKKTYPLPGYTHEDFLNLKKEAEEEFERQMIDRAVKEENKDEMEDHVLENCGNNVVETSGNETNAPKVVECK